MSINTIIQKIANQTTSFQEWLDGRLEGWTVQPVQAEGIEGFVFSVKQDDRLELSAEATDYVMEDGSVKQDHIVIKPEMITLRGLIGEVVLTTATRTGRVMGEVQRRLTLVSDYLPPLDASAQKIVDNAVNSVNTLVNGIDKAITTTNNIISAVSSTPPGDTFQQQAYANLKSMWKKKQIVSVVHPWGYLTNMAIVSIVFEQSEKSKLFTDCTVTLKQLTTTATENTNYFSDGRVANMLSKVVKKSNLTGVDQSTLESPCWSNMSNANIRNSFNYIQDPVTYGVSSVSLRSN